jgi:hypothetical protein
VSQTIAGDKNETLLWRRLHRPIGLRKEKRVAVSEGSRAADDRQMFGSATPSL